MIAEPSLSPAPVLAPGKETEIAELAQKSADAAAENDVLTGVLIRNIQEAFAVLPADKQSAVMIMLVGQMHEKNNALFEQQVNAINSKRILSVAGSLKNHPAWDDYERALRELREARRKEAELLYPDEAEALHPLAASFGALKNDPLWEEYEAALRDQKEEDRKRALEQFPDDEAA